MEHNKITIRAVARQFKNGYLFLPATPTDKRIMNEFCLSCGNGYVNLTVGKTRANKTYKQVKTFWALNDIAYQLQNAGVRPTVEQAENQYISFLDMFADKIPSPVKGQREIPVSLSRMSIGQASRFINSIMNFCLEQMGNAEDTSIITDVTELFNEFMTFRSGLEIDPIDVDSDGNFLTIDEWIRRNPASMANGEIQDVETHHIITKGSRPEFRYSVWNLVRLTHYQHIERIHGISEDDFLKLYPELKGRFDRARRFAAEYDKGKTELAQPKHSDSDDFIGSDDVEETVNTVHKPVADTTSYEMEDMIASALEEDDF